MELLFANLDLIIFILLLLFAVGYNIYKFLTSPSEKRREKILLFLTVSVVEAERIFKSETGKLKFSYVYNLFIEKFPILSKVLPKSVFEELVEKALTEMRNQIESNSQVRKYIEGEK